MRISISANHMINESILKKINVDYQFYLVKATTGGPWSSSSTACIAVFQSQTYGNEVILYKVIFWKKKLPFIMHFYFFIALGLPIIYILYFWETESYISDKLETLHGVWKVWRLESIHPCLISSSHSGFTWDVHKPIVYRNSNGSSYLYTDYHVVNSGYKRM